MSVRYLVDTDWAVNFLLGHPETTDRLRQFRPEGLALSVVSLAELYEGVFYSRSPQQSQQGLDDFLEAVTVLSVDEDICRLFGRERGRLRGAGQLIGDFDLLIGATALQRGLTLLTNNRRHFEMIEGLRLVSV